MFRPLLFLLLCGASKHLSALRIHDYSSKIRFPAMGQFSFADLPWLRRNLYQAVQVVAIGSTLFTARPAIIMADPSDLSTNSPQEIRQISSTRETVKDAEIFQLLRAGSLLNDPTLLLPSVNLPTDDFWYPPFLIGRWKTDLFFDYVELPPELDEVNIKELKESLPALSNSITDQGALIFQPTNVGKDIPNSKLMLRFVQLDSHPREDHPYNLRQLVSAFSDDQIIIDQAPYSFQKAPNWIYSPANRWFIDYHTKQGEKGRISLETMKRNIFVESGYAQTTEFFRQTREIIGKQDQSPTKKSSTFAVNWQLAPEKVIRGEFINENDLAGSDTVYGKLNFILYFEPSDQLYVTSKLGAQPAAIISYNVKMQRYLEDYDGKEVDITQATPSQRRDLIKLETKRSLYPYIPRHGVGPVELNQFFGY